MRKKVVWIIMIGAALAILAVGLWRYSAHEVNVTLEGVKYRLGTTNTSEVESATVHIEGTVRRTLNGRRLFRGTVEIEGETMPVPKEQMTNHTFSARKGEGFLIFYPRFEGDQMNTFLLGDLYANEDFSQITLTRYEQQEDGQSSGWSGGDGLMLSAPAKDRAEGILLANKLMAHRLEGLQPLK